MDKKRAFIAFFWAAGMIYTGHNLIENCIRYKQYNSMTINKYDKNGKFKSNTRLVVPYLFKSGDFGLMRERRVTKISRQLNQNLSDL